MAVAVKVKVPEEVEGVGATPRGATFSAAAAAAAAAEEETGSPVVIFFSTPSAVGTSGADHLVGRRRRVNGSVREKTARAIRSSSAGGRRKLEPRLRPHELEKRPRLVSTR